MFSSDRELRQIRWIRIRFWISWDGALPAEGVSSAIRVIAIIFGLAGKIRMGLKVEVGRITYVLP